MSYYSYKAARDALVKSGDMEFINEPLFAYVPIDKEKYGDEVDNEYHGNLFQMCADVIERQKKQLELAENLISKIRPSCINQKQMIDSYSKFKAK